MGASGASRGCAALAAPPQSQADVPGQAELVICDQSIERLHSWMNTYGKLRRCSDRDGTIVDFYLYLAAALVTIRTLIQRARTLYRWDTRPTTRRLK